MGKKREDIKKEGYRKSIRYNIFILWVIPALLMGIFLTIMSAQSLYQGMTQEVRNSLRLEARALYDTYSLVASGEYQWKDDRLMKGDSIISGDFRIVDFLKESSGMEVSLFYGDQCIVTSVPDKNGNRLIDMKADENAAYYVLEKGKEYFSTQVKINGVTYFGYYIPVYDNAKDKSVVGMAFAAKQKADIYQSIEAAVAKSVLLFFFVILAAVLIALALSSKLVTALNQIMIYLGHLSNGEFQHSMPNDVLSRKDEIGKMGKYAVAVSNSLSSMVTTDPLTTLYNRRSAYKMLEKQLMKSNKEKRLDLSIAIGDIDFFKKINDTYGHECGDMVLVEISEILQKKTEDHGLAARWGGEEFLLALRLPYPEAEECLKDILMEIRDHDFIYGDQHIKVTMSFGIEQAISGQLPDDIIRQADALLYEAKASGRDRIIGTNHRIILPDEREKTDE